MAALLGLAFVLCLCLAAPGASPSFAAAAVATSNADVVGNAGSGSVLQALLESQYSEWMELVEQAAMLHPLEQLVGSGSKLTIFAPQNHQLQPKIKSFLLKPSNAIALKRVVQYHVLSERVTSSEWPTASFTTLASEAVSLSAQGPILFAGDVAVSAPDAIIRPDGVVHGVEEMLIPNSVMQEYVAHTTRKMATPLPTGAPGLDTRRAQLLEKQYSAVEAKLVVAAASPSLPPALAPSIAPAPGPAMGPSTAPWLGFGDDEVTTFISAMLRFGGYTEFAGLLVDLTSLGSEISKLVNMGYKLTILAPDDKAWSGALTEEQLSSQTALEDILHYHIITEYQTEESLYSTLRRMGKTHFSTLRVPHKLSAHEVDGQVVFGEGDDAAGVFDHDIFADGRLSVQGIDRVMIPAEHKTSQPTETTESPPAPKVVKKNARNLFEMLQLPGSSSATVNAGPGSLAKGTTVYSALAACVVVVVNLLAL
ncbi:hypothetical protein Mapa_017342 [Marchantia paleacea]|nr:hypothetical protein Mapa_017342 [Marchantia paleacea]